MPVYPGALRLARRSRLLKKLISNREFQAPCRAPIEAILRHRFHDNRQLSFLLLVQFSLPGAIAKRMQVMQNYCMGYKLCNNRTAA